MLNILRNESTTYSKPTDPKAEEEKSFIDEIIEKYKKEENYYIFPVTSGLDINSIDEIVSFQLNFQVKCNEKEKEKEKEKEEENKEKKFFVGCYSFENYPINDTERKNAIIYFIYNKPKKEYFQHISFDEEKYNTLDNTLAGNNEDKDSTVLTDAIKILTSNELIDQYDKPVNNIDDEQKKEKLKKQIPTYSLDGITVKREKMKNSKITVIRQTTKGKEESVANSEYIEVQDEVFENLNDRQKEHYRTNQTKKFYIRVFFSDNGENPIIDDKSVYYFEGNNKITVSLESLGGNINFQSYRKNYYNNEDGAEERFKKQFHNTLKRISCCEIKINKKKDDVEINNYSSEEEKELKELREKEEEAELNKLEEQKAALEKKLADLEQQQKKQEQEQEQKQKEEEEAELNKLEEKRAALEKKLADLEKQQQQQKQEQKEENEARTGNEPGTGNEEGTGDEPGQNNFGRTSPPPSPPPSTPPTKVQPLPPANSNESAGTIYLKRLVDLMKPDKAKGLMNHLRKVAERIKQ